ELSDFYTKQKGELEDAIAQNFSAGWDVSGEDYMARFEKIVSGQPANVPPVLKVLQVTTNQERIMI
ncbi:MAG: hypothetical protein J6I40_00575, partial [Mailhella sp.]|nr:hypothetical protein [Mailhella sp.]